MKRYSIDSIFTLLLKYIWLICVALFVLEIAFTVNTAVMFTKITSRDIMSGTNRELENKLNITWKLADALAQDLMLTNTSISLEERALYLKPYNKVYELFLIGITDEQGKITSTYDNIPGEIGHRDYFQYSMSTGKSVITDSFPAGADSKTLNYTICVPYYDKESTPAGAIIMSIPFEGINKIITNVAPTSNFMFTLLGSDYKIMAEKEEELIGKDFSSLVYNSKYVSADKDEVVEAVHSGETGSYWTIEKGKILYVSYAPVENAPWTLMTSIDVLSSCYTVICTALFKIILMFLVFGIIAWLGKRYMAVKLADTGSMLLQMEKLQNNLREEKLITSDTIEELVSISKSGLLDSLTNLPTRLGIKKIVDRQIEQLSKNAQGAFVLIDLDDLKTLNDTYGHTTGDTAIASFGKALKIWAKENDCIAGRFGGDEFIAFFTGENQKKIVEEILAALRIEFEENGKKIFLHASIGVATYPNCGMDFQQLYIAADKALYRSKMSGKDCYTFSGEEL